MTQNNKTKVVILAGGKGTRIAEETQVRPKPMVEIGGRPIIWHIMKSYSAHGLNDFVICCGYLGDKVREYFLNYAYQNADLTISAGRPGRGAPEPFRALDHHPGRHRRRHHDRRADQAGGPLYRRRSVFLPDLWRRPVGCRHRRPGPLPRGAWRPGDDHRRHPPRPLRRPEDQGRHRRAVHREARRKADGSTAASSCCRPRCWT
jgi:hypothetical protein